MAEITSDRVDYLQLCYVGANTTLLFIICACMHLNYGMEKEISECKMGKRGSKMGEWEKQNR